MTDVTRADGTHTASIPRTTAATTQPAQQQPLLPTNPTTEGAAS